MAISTLNLINGQKILNYPKLIKINLVIRLKQESIMNNTKNKWNRLKVKQAYKLVYIKYKIFLSVCLSAIEIKLETFRYKHMNLI